MQSQEPSVVFNEKQASEYDRRFAKLAPMRDALHLLVGAVFAELPADARILCVGAGTGAEMIYLAGKFPGWRFTAVEPSGPMLDVCRRRADECGIAARCEFHEGFLDSLAPSKPFDAATSLLVSQFILSTETRAQFFRTIAGRLRPSGLLATADLASDLLSSDYENLIEVWLRLMQETGFSAEQAENLRSVYARDVAVLPTHQVSRIIASGGFDAPVLFLQTCLIHAWFTRRAAE